MYVQQSKCTIHPPPGSMPVEETAFIDREPFFSGIRLILYHSITLFQRVLHVQKTKQLFQVVCIVYKNQTTHIAALPGCMPIIESTFIDRESFFDGARMFLYYSITIFQPLLHAQTTKQLF